MNVMHRLNASYLGETRITDLAPSYREIEISGGLPIWPFALAGLIVLVGLAAWWIVRWLRVPCLPLSDDLTLELCRAHDIGLHHRTLLDLVARGAGRANTAELFLSPAIFDTAVQKAESVKPLRNRQRTLLHEVRRFLFD